jgi:cathepsin B
MKHFANLFCILVLVLTAVADRANFERFVKEHNKKPDETWIAGLSPRLNYDDDRSLRALIGTIPDSDEYIDQKIKNLRAQEAAEASKLNRNLQTLPNKVDLRVKYPNCPSIGEIRDQSQCGSCWAFATANVVTDAYCIQKSIIRSFAPQDLLTCCQTGCTGSSTDGCEGGYLGYAYDNMQLLGATTGEKFGDTTNKCKPYFLSPYATALAVAPPCSSTCVDSAVEFGRQKISGYRYFNGVTAMMTEIATRGPITSSFKVYEDFYAYRSGVYRSNKMYYMGGHAIRIIGYGIDSVTRVKFWLVANTWGNTWGENGFFRIRRGFNECEIERYLSYSPIFA